MFGDNNGTGMYMPVAPAQYGYGNNGGMFGGNDGWLVLLILLAAAGGNWGGMGGNNGSNLYPWMNQAQLTQSGIDNAQLIAAITSLQGSVSDGFARAQEANSAREISLMQQLFALQQQFSNCCCENRLATQQLNSTILSENCADRAALSDGVRDIITSQNNGFQRILDQMCTYQIQAKDEKISDLQRQLGEANTARLLENLGNRVVANNEAQTTALEQYLAPTPRPAWIVQNPNCCNQNFGCGCGN